MEKLKILVVDHSVLNRKNITDIVNTTEYGTVTRSASSGPIALEWMQQCDFDVILMDVFVVREIGVNRIQDIKKAHPSIEIIIMSEKKPESAALTLDAMNMGALDFILRSDEKNMDAVDLNVKNELEAIFTQIIVRQFLPKNHMPKAERPAESIVKERKRSIGKIDLVLIAASTGGPAALETICRQVPANFNKPILIVQHMPPDFTRALAESFDKKFKAVFKEGKLGEMVKPGTVIIAPGGFHMVLEEGFGSTTLIKLLETPFVNGVRPSADVLFQSAAKHYKGKNVLAVVLTGMGNDGVKGIEALKKDCNCYCITQSEDTCVVYGMPKCVYEAGLSDEVVGLNDIAYRITQLVEMGG